MYSEVPNGPSRRSGDVRDRGPEGRGCERLRNPRTCTGPAGEENVGLPVEQKNDRYGDLSIPDGVGHGDAAHRRYLEVDNGDVEVLFEDGVGGGGRIGMVDEFVVPDAERGVNFVHHPGLVGDDQYA